MKHVTDVVDGWMDAWMDGWMDERGREDECRDRREECPDRPQHTEPLTVTFVLVVETFHNKFEKPSNHFPK